MQVTDPPYPSMSTFLTGGVEGPEGGNHASFTTFKGSQIFCRKNAAL